jgi:TetR/AcrR family transcriptional regulator of autoinduction and epiphytic fitness
MDLVPDDVALDAAASEIEADVPVDGRTARAQRTREAIVEACVALINGGDVRPTAPRIAERAGVSVRSVFQHFDDLETLFAMVAERAVREVVDLLHPIPPDLPFAERLARLVAQRAELLEAITPIRRAAAVHGVGSPAIQGRVQSGHEFFRAEVEQVFGPELAAAVPARRERLLDMVDLAATWSSWDVLRTLDGRSVEEASEVMAEMIAVTLGAER